MRILNDMSPELYDWHVNKEGEAPVMRCAILDVVSWFPGRPATTLDRCQRAMSACRNGTTTVRRDQGQLHLQERDRENEALWDGRAIADFSKHMEDWAVKAPSCCANW